MFDKSVIEDAKRHAISEFPKESVGAVVNGKYVPLVNSHITPNEEFSVDDKDVLSLGLDNIQAVIHSHPQRGSEDPRLCPSKADMETQSAFGIPFGIIVCDNERAFPVVWFGAQAPIAPLEGRGYHWGVHDCYTLCRDYYRQEHGVVIPDEISEWGWWQKDDGADFYTEMLMKHPEHFQLIPKSQLKAGDAVLICHGLRAIKERKASHSAVYLGDERILHHLCSGVKIDPSRVSNVEPIHRWLPYITHFFRIKGVNGA